MTIPRGTRLGPYVIDAPLGAGGMGEVFKAHDTRLDRTVAIKVLPTQFAADPARQERFEREARAVAALNHPHICDLHDIGETPNLWFGSGRQESVRFLVMEYLEGQTLADRLVKGPLPISEVLRYSLQLADALAHAHRFGIVHRDLKPANVMLTRDGVKLLDFGISKLQPSFDLVTLPTVVPGSPPLTDDGVVLGTFPYMAPEHLAGRGTDARSDIFALGAMIFEMATGRRAFDGSTAASLSGAILHVDPPAVSALQPLAPAPLDRLVARCLAKDPDDRWQTARDVMLELRHIGERPLPQTAGRARLWKRGVIAGGILLAAAVVGSVYAARNVLRPPSDASSVRIEFSASNGLVFTDVEIGGHVSVSPNGARLVFVATGADDRQLLWIRSLDSLTAQPLGRTDGAAYPFWSPDSQFVGFFAQGKLKKIHTSGGPPENLCDAGQARGGTWNSDGTIIFSSGAGHELSRVSAAGGAATRLPDDPSNEERLWPYFLPDGVHFMYVARPQRPGIFAASIDSAQASRFVRDGVGVGFASGHLLTLVGSARGSEAGTLLAQPFDATRLEILGDASPLAEQVAYRSGPARAAFSVSENGRLVYRTFKRRATQLIWFDRRGADVGTLGRTLAYRHPALSADGKTIAAERIDPETETPDLWLIDTTRDVASRFTSDPALDLMPVWSPDSAQIVFASARGAPPNLYRKSVGGDGREVMFVNGSFNSQPTDWSRDGRYIVYAILHPKTQWDLWLQPMFGPEAERKPMPFLQTSFNEHLAQFSPDGRWIAYFSDESGANEVYVRAYPAAGAKWQVSSNGGTGPRWRADAKELFYVAADRTLMAVTVSSEPTFEASAPVALFKTRIGNPDGASFDTNYAVTADGQRFLISTLVDQSNDSPATLVLNWPAALRRP